MATSDIFLVILLASASILCLALVIFIYRITRSIEKIEADVNELTGSIKPLISSTTELSGKLNTIADDVKHEINNAQGIVGDVRERVDLILNLEQNVRRRLEGPLVELAKNISAVINGVNAFWNAYRK